MTKHLALIVLPDRVVRQVLITDRDIGNPGGVWHDVTDHPEVKVGWIMDAAGGFSAPPPVPPAVETPAPTIAQLKAQMDVIAAQLARLE